VDSGDYRRIEKAISFLQENSLRRLSLEDTAKQVGLSFYQFQRLFRRWAGVTPKQFLQLLTVEHSRKLLRDSATVFDTAYSVGPSDPGRLHDLFVSVETVTPGRFKTQGRGIAIRFGTYSSPFGNCLAALTEKGICELRFLDDDGIDRAVERLSRRWRGAELYEDQAGCRQIVERIFSRSAPSEDVPLRLFLMGTNFQTQVWKALLRIPEGSVISYEDLARWVHRPSAARAVGNAVGQNPISYLIPCHRVIRKTGELGGYGGGISRKMAILGREFALNASLTSTRLSPE